MLIAIATRRIRDGSFVCKQEPSTIEAEQTIEPRSHICPVRLALLRQNCKGLKKQ